MRGQRSQPCPDSFPLKSTVRQRQEMLTTAFEAWPGLQQEIASDLGFGLERKPTLAAGKRLPSVFLRVKGAAPLSAGSLVGFFPGLYRSAMRAELYLTSKALLRPNSFRFLVNELLPHPNDGYASLYEFRRKCEAGESV